MISSGINNIAAANPTSVAPNGLTRSRRSHFSHGDATLMDPNGATAKNQTADLITYEIERLIYLSKTPHSWALPHDWDKICELYPLIVRNKVCDKINNNNKGNINNNDNSNAVNNNNNNNINNNNVNNNYLSNMFKRRSMTTSN